MSNTIIDDEVEKVTQDEALQKFDEMKDLARKLSNGIPFVRTDFYFVNVKVYFGELTFYHDAGLVSFEPECWNERLGDMIVLPIKDKKC